MSSTPVHAGAAIVTQAHRSVLAETKAYQRALNEIQQSAGPRSPYRDDLAWCKAAANHKHRAPRKRLMGLVQQQCSHMTANVFDHLRSTASDLNQHPWPLYSPMTSARVAVEAAARIIHMLDGTVTPDERLIRGSAMLLHSFDEEAIATARLVSYPEVHLNQIKGRDKLIDILSRAGMIVRRRPNGRPNGVTWTPTERYPRFPAEISALVDNAFAEYPMAYQLGSGVAHSLSWMLDDNATLPGDSEFMVYHPDPLQLGAAAILAIAAAEAVTRAFGAYMSVDVHSALIACRRRREAIDREIDIFSGLLRANVVITR